MATEKPSIVFFGTPEFAIPSLRLLATDKQFDLKAVVTQPDKPSGRGLKLTPSPVRTLATELGIPVFQPPTLKMDYKAISAENREPSDIERFKHFVTEQHFDVFVAVAYGKIIPSALLSVPRLGIINIHPSLLPRWRGAAPIQHTIFAGDLETGVCIMQIDEGIDSGPIFAVRRLSILENDDFGTLHNKLSELGAKLLVDSLPRIICGELKPIQQSTEGITYAEKWEKEDLEIHWSEPATVTERRIRASSPNHGARTFLNGELVKIFSAVLLPKNIVNSSNQETPGTIVGKNSLELIVRCGDGNYLGVQEMQFPGKKCLSVGEILRGKNIKIGEVFDAS